jgi:MraZ protein
MLFISTHESGVDAKRRVSVPSEFRKSLAGEESVFIWPSVNKPCLEGGGEKLVLKLRRAIYRMAGEEREAFQLKLLRKIRSCRLDEGGRIVLDNELLAHAQLGERVSFTGVGDRFLIWNPALLEERERRHDEIVAQKYGALEALEEDDLPPLKFDERRGFE